MDVSQQQQVMAALPGMKAAFLQELHLCLCQRVAHCPGLLQNSPSSVSLLSVSSHYRLVSGLQKDQDSNRSQRL